VMTKPTLIGCCSPLGRPTLTEAEAVQLEQLFKALADRHRVRILNLLAGADDAICVCKLTPDLDLSQPAVSYHLKLLVNAGLITREQRGNFGFYRLSPGALERLGELVSGPGGLAERAA
jgi:ArsR family transcriptional regulator, arsenate/arsenite/antimonite-responsive transcriptional repressor